MILVCSIRVSVTQSWLGLGKPKSCMRENLFHNRKQYYDKFFNLPNFIIIFYDNCRTRRIWTFIAEWRRFYRPVISTHLPFVRYLRKAEALISNRCRSNSLAGNAGSCQLTFRIAEEGRLELPQRSSRYSCFQDSVPLSVGFFRIFVANYSLFCDELVPVTGFEPVQTQGLSLLSLPVWISQTGILSSF